MEEGNLKDVSLEDQRHGKWKGMKNKWIWKKNTMSGQEKEMATCSSILAWRIPGTEEPGGLPSMGSQRVRHDWSDLTAAEQQESLGKWKGGFGPRDEWTINVDVKLWHWTCWWETHWRLLGKDSPCRIGLRKMITATEGVGEKEARGTHTGTYSFSEKE